MPLSSQRQNVTEQDIMRTLETIRNSPTRTYTRPADTYKDFMPQAYIKPSTTRDEQSYFRMLEDVENVGKNAMALQTIKAQNLRNKREAERAAQARAQSLSNPVGGGMPINSGGGSQPGPVKGFNPRASLGTYQWRGYNLTLNSSVANRFIGFLNALSATGYKIKSIGTYANRNIAGTNVQSLHALGLAMDINPGQNPVTWNGQNITDLPPNVGALAAKYGLTWGGNWNGSKRDTMHFSVPYGGRK